MVSKDMDGDINPFFAQVGLPQPNVVIHGENNPDLPGGESTTMSKLLDSSGLAAPLAARLAEGLQPEEIGVFVRSAVQLARARRAVKHTGAEAAELDDRIAPPSQHIAISTMHLAKGLEFRAVAVMACDDEVLPLQSRIETVTDVSDLEEVYNTERHLLYVACTRARDLLLITGVEPASEFLDDLMMG